MLSHPVDLRRGLSDPVVTVRIAALLWVGLASAVLALGAGWLAARFVVAQWNQGNPVADSGFVLERDLLAFGTAVPAYAAVAASCAMFGLSGMRARERWEGVTALFALASFTVLGLLVTVA